MTTSRARSPAATREELPGKKVAILHDNSAYGKGLADETKKALNAAGVQEALYAAYTPGERDYSAIVSRMKQAGIDVIYIGGYHTEAGLILRQAKEQGMNATLIGGDALVTQRVLADRRRRGRGHADDLLAPTRASAPRRPRWCSASGPRTSIPEGYVLYTYAAIQIWADAATKANTSTQADR